MKKILFLVCLASGVLFAGKKALHGQDDSPPVAGPDKPEPVSEETENNQGEPDIQGSETEDVEKEPEEPRSEPGPRPVMQKPEKTRTSQQDPPKPVEGSMNSPQSSLLSPPLKKGALRRWVKNALSLTARVPIFSLHHLF